ncbi:MAG: tyrosine-type recombinase/integrase [Alphaproteobacteria bacterium]|nr:tyrosine-type recombinase/integrase [Alphaproteobacteria bacterium]MBP7760144.1 tyrosine-type recombinase/integrase [Alphaproteobacteria bacterium]MBP7763513.1 tyrosine-type recombinase/integrase [Alphaproteobacteria bacterium]
MKLTNTACRTAKAKDKPYKMADGGGLFLLIKPDGSKYWRMKYRFLGKEKLLAFGTYPLISLADAREEREAAKKLLAGGIDPAKYRKEEKRRTIRNAQNTFKAVALEWHQNQKDRWSDNHAQNVLHRLETDIFPYIGAEPLASIEAPDLLDTLRKIEKRGALDIAKRSRQICGQVFRYGIQTGRCKRDPSHDLQGALKTRKTNHFAALEAKEIPEFLAALERNDARLYARTRRAIRLSLLTFVRPGEIREARWEEIDFEAREWTIPAKRMKMKRSHIVPLSRQALAILKEQKEETGCLSTPWVFPSQIRSKDPMSNGTVNVAIKKLGFQGRMTAHGFRALARTTIREKLDYAPDIIEAALAHKPAGPLGEAYDRTKFLTQRKKMMQDWADFLDTVANEGRVVVGDFKRRA